jgi:Protein of unknown function (DUF3631)
VNVEVASVLADTEKYVRRYISLTDAESCAIALWTLHTHAFDATDLTPYVSITSAEMESGKTRLLETLRHIVARPWFTGRVTAAVLSRKIDKETPTLLLDESDAAFNGDKEYAEVLRGVLNSGYERGGVSSICVRRGNEISYADLSTFCPKAIAGIGRLPDMVASRSIPIRLKRKAPGENVERMYRRDIGDVAEPIRQWLENLAAFHSDRLSDARPQLPAELRDRTADVWEPLFAVADLAGGDWPNRARAAASELSGRGSEVSGHTRLTPRRSRYSRQEASLSAWRPPERFATVQPHGYSVQHWSSMWPLRSQHSASSGHVTFASSTTQTTYGRATGTPTSRTSSTRW